MVVLRGFIVLSEFFTPSSRTIYKKECTEKNGDGFRSRNLLHSIAKFSKSDWRAEEIAEYYNEMKTQIDTLYEK